MQAHAMSCLICCHLTVYCQPPCIKVTHISENILREEIYTWIFWQHDLDGAMCCYNLCLLDLHNKHDEQYWTIMTWILTDCYEVLSVFGELHVQISLFLCVYNYYIIVTSTRSPKCIQIYSYTCTCFLSVHKMSLNLQRSVKRSMHPLSLELRSVTFSHRHWRLPAVINYVIADIHAITELLACVLVSFLEGSRNETICILCSHLTAAIARSQASKGQRT